MLGEVLSPEFHVGYSMCPGVCPEREALMVLRSDLRQQVDRLRSKTASHLSEIMWEKIVGCAKLETDTALKRFDLVQ